MPNLINVIFTLFIGIVISHSSLKEETKRKLFLFLVWFSLSFVAGTRGLFALNDTQAYAYVYIASKNKSLVYYLKNIENDFFYYFINWCFSNIGVPWQLFLVLFSAFVFGVFCYWINKNSEDPLVSMLIFECIFLNAWQMVMRQTLGTAFILIAYECLKKNDKKYKFLSFLLLTISIMCHSTAVIFPLYLIIRKHRMDNITILISLTITVMCYLFRSKLLVILNLFADLFNRNSYNSFWEENPTNLILISTLLLILVIVLYRGLIITNPMISEYIYALILMIAFLSFGGGAMVRLAWYFGIFICLIIPIVLKNVKPTLLSSTIAIVILLSFYLLNINTKQWYFFWQK